MIQPEHPVEPAFNDARDKIAFMERRLSEVQKGQYDEFIKAQEKAKEEQKEKTERAKAAYDQAKEKHPHLVRNYDPPVKIRDPKLRRMALAAQAQHHKATNLERTQMEDRVRMLEKLDQQQDKQPRHRDTAQHTTRSRPHPEFTRAASPPRQHPDRAARRGQESALSRTFAMAEQQQEQTKQCTQAQEHGSNRERSRN